MPHQGPGRYGLYEPETEHDACGVGFVAHIKGEKSRGIVEEALELLNRLSHRAAAGQRSRDRGRRRHPACSSRTASSSARPALGFDAAAAPPVRRGQVFLPSDAEARRLRGGPRAGGHRRGPARARLARRAGGRPRTWARLAREVVPVIRQLFVARRRVVPSAFERKLYLIRKLAENRIRERGLDPDGQFHVASFSAETIIYKGLLLPRQLPRFYVDLQHPELVSALGAGALALLHQHLPHLGAGAAVPLHRPQRRNQHAARQPQLDERAARAAAVGEVRRQPGAASSRSSSPARATRRSSTTWSSCCTWAAARCRTR